MIKTYKTSEGLGGRQLSDPATLSADVETETVLKFKLFSWLRMVFFYVCL